MEISCTLDLMSNQNYIIGVSGGPDSMALLDILHDKIKLIVVHVNYHKRESAIRDQNIVEDYCVKNDITYYIFDYIDIKQGNFQENARKFRYDCFKSICRKYNSNNILVAHQLEDHLETYLMQIKRKQIPNIYGLKESICIDGYNIIRPLLNVSKTQILEYLKEHNIEYGIDESNLITKYQRNDIRINIISKMSAIQIDELIYKIHNENIKLLDKQNRASKLIINDSINYNDLIMYDDYQTLLRIFLNKYVDNLSYKFIDELYRQIIKSDKHVFYFDKILLVNDKKLLTLKSCDYNYEYNFNSIEEFKCEYFKIVKHSDKFHSCTIEKKDFPIKIRNCKPGDSIKLRYGTKRLSRWFIDHHINEYDRLIWPVITNCENEIILVPQIGCSVAYYSNNPNLFVVK